MKHTSLASLRILRAFVVRRRWQSLAVLAVLASMPLLAISLGYTLIEPDTKYILASANTLAGRHGQIAGKHIAIGLVLGAGVDKHGRPYKELRSRLDVAAAALRAGDVQKLILSGDNRFVGYDEPTAMRNYLMQTYHIPASKLQPDFAGRSTYESCQRATQVFGQDRLVLFSAGSHLPRAIYLCRHFGIEAYGIASDVEANNATRREAVARVKALYNVYIHGETTVLGARISL